MIAIFVVLNLAIVLVVIQRVRYRRRVEAFAELAGVKRAERESDASLLDRAANRFRIVRDGGGRKS